MSGGGVLHRKAVIKPRRKSGVSYFRTVAIFFFSEVGGGDAMPTQCTGCSWPRNSVNFYTPNALFTAHKAVYSSSINNRRLLKFLSRPAGKQITHFMELECSLRYSQRLPFDPSLNPWRTEGGEFGGVQTPPPPEIPKLSQIPRSVENKSVTTS
jgi:hypothetical protein